MESASLHQLGARRLGARRVAITARWGSSLLAAVTCDVSRGVAIGDPSATSRRVDLPLPESVTGTAWAWLVRAEGDVLLAVPPPRAETTVTDGVVELTLGDVSVTLRDVDDGDPVAPRPVIARTLVAGLLLSAAGHAGVLERGRFLVAEGGASLAATERAERQILGRSILLRIEATEWSDENGGNFAEHLAGRWYHRGWARGPIFQPPPPMPPDEPPRARPRSLAVGTVVIEPAPPGTGVPEGYRRCLEAALLRDVKSSGVVKLTRTGAGPPRLDDPGSTADLELRACALRVAAHRPRDTFGDGAGVTIRFAPFEPPRRP